MVDALRAAHRVTRRGGIVIDARPDHSRRPRLIAGGRVRGHIHQSEDADARDTRSDGAVRKVIALGLYRSTGTRGVVWHRTRYSSLAEMDEYLSDSARYGGYERGTRQALIPFRRGPIDMRRAIKFELLERL